MRGVVHNVQAATQQGMPGCVAIGFAGVPEVDVPAESVSRLATDAARTAAAERMGLFAERRRRKAEARFPACGPCPAVRRAAAGREGAGEPVGA